MDAAQQINKHLDESKLTGGEDLEDGDIITAAVVVMRIERLDEDTPAFVAVHTGDFITATGLLTLAQGMVVSGIFTDEED